MCVPRCWSKAPNARLTLIARHIADPEPFGKRVVVIEHELVESSQEGAPTHLRGDDGKARFAPHIEDLSGKGRSHQPFEQELVAEPSLPLRDKSGEMSARPRPAGRAIEG